MPAVSLRLGHAAALGCHRQPIHYRAPASQPQGKPPAAAGTGDDNIRVNEKRDHIATRTLAFPWGKVARSAG